MSEQSLQVFGLCVASCRISRPQEDVLYPVADNGNHSNRLPVLSNNAACAGYGKSHKRHCDFSLFAKGEYRCWGRHQIALFLDILSKAEVCSWPSPGALKCMLVAPRQSIGGDSCYHATATLWR